MRLFVVRHGVTQHNLDGRATGQIDAPLSALGKRQAEALADRLATWRFDAIISSDLERAHATALTIAARQNTDIELDADLREIDMGAWSGKPYADWTQRERDLFAEMERDETGAVRAPGGESLGELTRRVERSLERTREHYSDGIALWVTHGGVISALLVRALGIGFDRRQQFRRDNCAIFELVYAGERVSIARLNDTAHLESLSALEAGETRQVL